MGNKKVMSNVIKNKRIRLIEVSAKRLDAPVSDGKNVEEVSFDISPSYEIIKKSEDMVEIRVDISAGFKPERFFKINMSFSVEARLSENISNDSTDALIEHLAPSIGNEMSFLISTLTNQMNGSPVVIPPILNFTKNDE